MDVKWTLATRDEFEVLYRGQHELATLYSQRRMMPFGQRTRVLYDEAGDYRISLHGVMMIIGDSASLTPALERFGPVRFVTQRPTQCYVGHAAGWHGSGCAVVAICGGTLGPNGWLKGTAVRYQPFSTVDENSPRSYCLSLKVVQSALLGVA